MSPALAGQNPGWAAPAFSSAHAGYDTTILSRRLCGPQRLPYLAGRRRHVDVIDAERFECIQQRVDDRRRRGDTARFTDALDAERIGLRRNFLELAHDVGKMLGARHGVIHEAAGHELPGLW